TTIYTLSLHDALPILGSVEREPIRVAVRVACHREVVAGQNLVSQVTGPDGGPVRGLVDVGDVRDKVARPRRPSVQDAVVDLPSRSEEHTSELQSRENL